MTKTAKIPYKALHNQFGIDWQKKELISIHKHTGKFTFKSLAKEFNLNKDNLNLVFISVTEFGTNCFKGVILKGYDVDKYDLLSDNKYRHLDTFYSKQEVEAVRKQDNIEVYVISINKEALTEIEEPQWSAWNLVKGAKYTDRITLKNREVYLNGCKQDLVSYYDVQRLMDDLDKNGYSILDKRRNLKAKLDEEKLNKLIKVKDTAFNEKNAEIYTKLLYAREVVTKELQNADTKDEIARVIYRLESLRGAFGSYERHLRRLDNILLAKIKGYDKYSSVTEVKNELYQMNKYISENFCNEILTNYAI